MNDELEIMNYSFSHRPSSLDLYSLPFALCTMQICLTPKSAQHVP